MLDRRMVYTCGRWENAADLNEAQEAKLHFVCRKLSLSPGMRVLDIGCGWGSFAKFAAENYGVQVVGITVSQEQLKLARTLCSGLPVELRLEDYREVHDCFDRVVSLGMFEHVGSKNYRDFLSRSPSYNPERRQVISCHNRIQQNGSYHRPMDGAIHFPKFPSSFRLANRRGHRRPLPSRGLAELGPGL